MSTPHDIYREEGPPPHVILQEVSWKEEEEGEGEGERPEKEEKEGVSISLSPPPSSSLTVVSSHPDDPTTPGKLFAESARILLLTQKKKDCPLHEVQNQQLADFESQVIKLSLLINESLIELGMLIVEGGKLGIHRLSGYDTMIDWMMNGTAHLSPQLVSMATNRYQVWRYVRQFGVGHQDLAHIENTQLKLLRRIQIDVDRQLKLAAKRQAISYLQEEMEEEDVPKNLEEMKFEEIMSLVPSARRTEVREKARQEYEALMTAEIWHVLESDPQELRTDEVRSGEVVKPTFTLKVSFDPLTGRLEGRFSTYLEAGHYLAMQKNQATIRFEISPKSETTPDSLNMQELGQYLEALSESFPPY